MTDKPEIKVGQRWVTRGGLIGRVLATDSVHSYPVVVEFLDGALVRYDEKGVSAYVDDPVRFELLSLAPSTVKREVALYRVAEDEVMIALSSIESGLHNGCRRISEPITIEFVLLPGETA